jgi:hypothetical protein
MKSTRTVVAVAASAHAAKRGGANRRGFPSTMAAQTRSPKQLPNGREREDECADRPGTALWWSVFTFFMEGFAAYGAAVHGVSVEAFWTAAKAAHPWSARRTPIATEDEHGLHLISENGNVVEFDRAVTIPVSQAARIG